MDISNLYNLWLLKAVEDEDLINELKTVENNLPEIEDRFYKNLEFGTGGLRGIIGAGTNRINIYTIRKASQGLANYLNKSYTNPSVAIAYDSRIKSEIFAKNAAGVLASNGIKVYIYKELMPTPSLSFAVRELKCSAGIVITASHNPSKYNGYKVYGDDGCQITLDMANKVFEEIEKIDIFKDIKYNNFENESEKKHIEYIPENITEKYLKTVSAQSINKNMPKKEQLNIVYTPLNGAGLRCVTDVLKMNGFSNITIVPEQEKPDGNFPTCPYPNPEIKEALELGLKLASKVNADLLLATDPDCDRVGIAIKNNNDYKLLTGNQVGILLFDYICKNKIKNNTMPKAPIVIKTIVTTDMVEPLAKNYNVEIINVLTGFKFIGEQIGYLEEKGEESRYIFGFEESYGYLSGSYVRDKDAVNASLLICEMAAYYKNQNKTLIDVLNSLYEKYGYYETALTSFEFTGITGFKKMQNLMEQIRTNFEKNICGKNIVEKYDYLTSVKTLTNNNKTTEIKLPKSNVIKFVLDGNNSIVIRPSGTEPKLKIYYSAQENSAQKAKDIIKQLDTYFKNFIQNF